MAGGVWCGHGHCGATGRLPCHLWCQNSQEVSLLLRKSVARWASHFADAYASCVCRKPANMALDNPYDTGFDGQSNKAYEDSDHEQTGL